MSRPQRPNLPGIYSDYYPREFQEYNTQYKGQIESIGAKLWDTQTFVSGTTVSLVQFFNVRATPDLSNMEVAFQLPAPKAFLVRAIRLYVKFRPTSITPSGSPTIETGAYDDLVQLINTGVLKLEIGNKTYDQEPLWVLTSGGGAYGILTTGSYAQNGIPDPRAVNTLSKPLFIAPQINFNARIDWAATLTLAGGNPAITVLLDGDQLRPVQ